MRNFTLIFFRSWHVLVLDASILELTGSLKGIPSQRLETTEHAICLPERLIKWIPCINHTLPDFDVHIAHLFSCHRRYEDLQSVLEGYGFKTLSIDIIFDKVKGNLRHGVRLSVFARALYASRYYGSRAWRAHRVRLGPRWLS